MKPSLKHIFDIAIGHVLAKDQNKVQKLSRIAIPLVLALMLFALAGLTSTGKAFASTTCDNTFQQKASVVVSSDDGSHPSIGVTSIWVNACNNTAYARISCNITTDFIQSMVQNFAHSSSPNWSASQSCAPGQFVDSPTVTYTPKQTCALGYIGDSYLFLNDNSSNEGTGWICA